jgi:mono/diheme cytochrome c family protein
MEHPLDIVKYLIATMTASLLLSSCSGNHDQPNVELIQDMMESPGIRAQEAGPQGMRRPPEGTVPRDFDVYPYKDDPISAEKELRSPIELNDANRTRGKQLFETYCYVCHGISGKGDGPVASKMIVKPPALVSDKVRDFKDGRIFHIITAGQGVMSAYASQINDPDDRWRIVQYVRQLQSGGK